jgi:EmrB/QacA subfamily drug resistance transporter
VSRRTLSQERVVVFVYMVGLYMTVVDSTIIYTALPSLARDFHASLDGAQWVTLSYLLSLAVMVPSSGWIGDRFGTRRTYLVALVLFTVASALCGLAGSLGELVVFRAVQGIGGGLIIPVGQAMLFRTFPPSRRARAAGMIALGTMLGPATGPVLGGVLVTELSWRWCFFVNVPLGIAVLAVGALFLAEHREPASGRLDVAGFLLAGGGLALCLYALSESAVTTWSDPAVVVTGAAGLVALVALVVVELRVATPMLNLRLLHDRIFRAGSLVFLLNQCCYTGYLFIMPEFLQQARGDSALASGLTTLPGAIGLWLNAQLAARVYPRSGPRRMVLAGAAGVACILCLFGFTLEVSTNVWLIRLLAFCSGSSIAWCNIAIQAASFSTISSADTGRASALFNTLSRVAGGVGVAVLVTVVTASSVTSSGHAKTGAALVPAFHHAFLTAAAFIVAAGLAALAIRDSDAAASMLARVRRPPAPVSVSEEAPPSPSPTLGEAHSRVQVQVVVHSGSAHRRGLPAARPPGRARHGVGVRRLQRRGHADTAGQHRGVQPVPAQDEGADRQRGLGPCRSRVRPPRIRTRRSRGPPSGTISSSSTRGGTSRLAAMT